MEVKKYRIGLFAYNFEHKKTYDFILRMIAEKIPVDVIFAADPLKLSIPPSSIKSKIRHQAMMHPRVMAENLGIKYIVCKHNSDEVVNTIKKHELDIGIIAGARILKRSVIDAFKLGVINYHPGMLPEIRGLDALFWSIEKDIPLGVSAHLIDHRVDAGSLLFKKQIAVYADDSIYDLSERLYEVQLDMIRESIEKTIEGAFETIRHTNEYNRKMSIEQEEEVIKKIPVYIKKYAIQ